MEYKLEKVVVDGKEAYLHVDEKTGIKVYFYFGGTPEQDEIIKRDLTKIMKDIIYNNIVNHRL